MLENEYQPVVILWIKSPWVGNEANFVLYQSGLIIFRRDVHRFFSVQLDAQSYRDFIAELPIKAFFELAGSYSVSNATDQAQNVIGLWQDGIAKRVSIYGVLSGKDTIPEIISTSQDHHPHPDAFGTIFNKLANFEHAQATPWLPEKIEVKVWEWDTPAESILWNPAFPDLNHPDTRPNPYSLYNAHIILLPSEHLAELQRLHQAVKPILINGKKWALSYRFPIPNEDMIDKPNAS